MTAGPAAIVLAAGYSSRMGDFKPLMPLGEVTVIERVVSMFRKAGIEDIRVIVGHRADEVIPILAELNVEAVLNPDYHEGMFTSVTAGLGGLGPDIEACFIQPVDIPLVRSETIRRLVHTYGQVEGKVLHPCFLGQRGHPPLINKGCFEAILGWHGDGGLRAVLQQYESAAVDVDVADEYILLDLDRPEDYRKLLARQRGYEFPSPSECQAVLDIMGVEERVLNHGRAAARLAAFLAGELNRAGCQLDVDLIRAAALLHDLAKGRPDHAREGGRILSEMGFPRAADLVAAHADGPIVDREAVSASEVVFIADKLLKVDRLVTLDRRFLPWMERHGGDPHIREILERRYKKAVTIKGRIENKTGRSFDDLLEEYRRQDH